ncbi:polymorphic toxin-type HINT domain-containing protein [Streptomyces sp. NPDC059247]|uniref:polymorphic toxin-type HINT domain-containing protein n=1 Tax=Streptomyces sp. NPDC059247 TaxID=3346790 RepID=UPI0036B99956
MSVGIVFGSVGRLAVRGFTAARGLRKASRVKRYYSPAKRVFRRTGCRTRNSFIPETLVLMADGSYLPIGTIQVGDYVAATAPETDVTTSQPVLELISGFDTKQTVEIDADLDPLTPAVKATAGHPFWVVDKGWTKASDVKAGDIPTSTVEGTFQVADVRNLGELPDQLVFNLNVGNVHTFTVKVGTHDAVTHSASSRGHGRHYGVGKKFTKRSERIILKANAMKYGIARCEYCGVPLKSSRKSMSGVMPPRATSTRRITDAR